MLRGKVLNSTCRLHEGSAEYHGSSEEHEESHLRDAAARHVVPAVLLPASDTG